MLKKKIELRLDGYSNIKVAENEADVMNRDGASIFEQRTATFPSPRRLGVSISKVAARVEPNKDAVADSYSIIISAEVSSKGAGAPASIEMWIDRAVAGTESTRIRKL